MSKSVQNIVQTIHQMAKGDAKEIRQGLALVRAAPLEAARQAFEQTISSSDSGVKQSAISAAGAGLGPKGKFAIPALSAIFNDSTEARPARTMAARALGLIGEEALPVLRKAASAPDAFVRRHVTSALLAMATSRPNPCPVDILCELVLDSDPLVRLGALEAIGGFGKDARPELERRMSQSPSSAIAAALLTIDRESPAAREHLFRDLKDGDARVRKEALLAMVRSFGEPIDTPESLFHLVESNGKESRSMFRRSAVLKKSDLPKIVPLLGDADADARRLAAYCVFVTSHRYRTVSLSTDMFTLDDPIVLGYLLGTVRNTGLLDGDAKRLLDQLWRDNEDLRPLIAEARRAVATQKKK